MHREKIGYAISYARFPYINANNFKASDKILFTMQARFRKSFQLQPINNDDFLQTSREKFTDVNTSETYTIGGDGDVKFDDNGLPVIGYVTLSFQDYAELLDEPISSPLLMHII